MQTSLPKSLMTVALLLAVLALGSLVTPFLSTFGANQPPGGNFQDNGSNFQRNNENLPNKDDPQSVGQTLCGSSFGTG